MADIIYDEYVRLFQALRSAVSDPGPLDPGALVSGQRGGLARVVAEIAARDAAQVAEPKSRTELLIELLRGRTAA